MHKIKKFFLLTFLGALFVVSAIGLTACKNSETPHTHTLEHHNGVQATCTQNGTIEYWSCSGCNKNFSDEGATTEITNITINKIAHTVSFVQKVDSTCEAAGNIAHYKCSMCNKTFEDENATNEIASVVIDPAHALTHHAKVEETCTENGVKEYYSCSKCNKNYSDSKGYNVLTDVVITASHQLNHNAKVNATCTSDGFEEYWNCTRCGKNYSNSTATAEVADLSTLKIEKGHILTFHAEKTASCESKGNIAYYSCSRCSNNYLDNNGSTLAGTIEVTVPHNMTHHTYNAATCTEEGNIEYWACSSCNKNYSDVNGNNKVTKITIDALQHKYSNPTWTWTGYSNATVKLVCEHNSSHIVNENAVITNNVTKTPNCVDTGTRTYTAKATVNSQQYTDTKDETIAIDETNHKDLRSSGQYSICEGGTKENSCWACWEEWNDVLTAQGHNYVSGVCSTCNANKPTNQFKAEYVVNGNQVTVTVKLTGVVKVAGFNVTIGYDDSVLKLVNTQQGAFSVTENKGTAGQVVLVHTNSTSTTAEGTVLTLTFAVKKTENTNVTITVNEIKETWYDNSIHETSSTASGANITLA